MTTPTNPDALNELRTLLDRHGLTDVVVVPAPVLPTPPVEPAALAWGQTEVADLAALAAQLDFPFELPIPGAFEAGFTAYRPVSQPVGRDLYLLRHQDDAAAIDVLANEGQWARRSESSVVFDLSGASPAVGLYAKAARAGLGLARGTAPGVPKSGLLVPPIPRVGSLPTPPLATWLMQSEDTWLRDEVARRRASGDPWDDIVSAALLARLERKPPARVDAERAAFRAGQVDAFVSPAVVWARTWSERERDTVGRAATSDADFVLSELEELQALLLDELDWGPDDERALFARLRAARVGRDDLEGVATLVRAAGGFSPLDAALRACDGLGADVVQSLDHDPEVGDDTQLARAASANPEGWWTATDGDMGGAMGLDDLDGFGFDDPDDYDDDDDG